VNRKATKKSMAYGKSVERKSFSRNPPLPVFIEGPRGSVFQPSRHRGTDEHRNSSRRPRVLEGNLRNSMEGDLMTPTAPCWLNGQASTSQIVIEARR
jgi:hypothetical protein